MGSVERGSHLPIINIAPYWETQSSPNHAEREAVSKALHSACVEYGFFYLDISKCVDPAEGEELTRLAREFFGLPQAEKDKISLRHQDFARGAAQRFESRTPTCCLQPLTLFAPIAGYQRLKENVTNGKTDNHEGIDFYKPADKPDKSRPLGGENQWPSVPDFQAKYEKWIEKMQKVGMILMEAQVSFFPMSYGVCVRLSGSPGWRMD